MHTPRRKKPAAAPQFEVLEPRQLLSGVVTTSLVAGALTITGDANPNDIAITKSANTVTITGNDSETFAGAGATINNVTGAIKIVMLGGADDVTLGQASGTFHVGNDTPPSGQPNKQNPKDLSIDMGDGADTLQLIGVSAGNVTIVGGAGFNNISLLDNGGTDFLTASTLVHGNLSITNGIDGCNIEMAGTQVLFKATIAMGNGTNQFTMQQNTSLPATFGSTVVGALTVTGGTGNDTVILSGETQDGDNATTVHGLVTINLGAAPLGGGNSLTLDGFDANAGLTVTGGVGDDTVLIQNLGATVNGAATFNLGTNADIGTNQLTVTSDNDFNVSGNLTYTGGVGEDDVEFGETGTTQIGGNATFTLGAGTNSVEFDSSAETLFAIYRNLTVTGGAGDDTITLIDSFAGSGGAAAWIAGSATFNLGAGTNQVDITGLNDNFIITGGVSYTGTTGDDSFEVSDTFLAVGGNLTLAMGAGDNNATLADTTDSNIVVTGNFSYTGGAGSDSVSSTSTVTVMGAVAIALGAGDNTVSFTSSGDSALSVNGALTLTGGAALGSNDVTLGDYIYVGGNFTCTFSGTDTLTLTNGMEVYGKVTYTGGTGADTLDLNSLYVLGATSINTGAGNDSVAIYNGAVIHGALSITTGAGNSSIYLGDDATQAGGWDPTIITNNAAVKMGVGTENLVLGYSESTPTLIMFGQKVSAAVGTGLATDHTMTIGNIHMAYTPTSTGLWTTVNV